MIIKKSLGFNLVGLIFSALIGFSLPLKADDEAVVMEEIKIHGHTQDLALPNKELSTEDLQGAQSGNLSKFLEEMPGINNASFGEGVGRPVIRGMSANRVKLSVNGASNADVSSMSSDHAPMMDMANAENVEVIYGPNTLRFGGGAMGGLVNVNDGRFHEEIFSGNKGRLQTSIGSNANSSQFAGSIDMGVANGDLSRGHVTHLDFYTRQSDNFSAGELNGVSAEIDSSSTEAQGGSVAYNFLDSQKGNAGIAWGFSDYEYGVPNNTNTDSKVTPEQWRVDIQGSLFTPFNNLERWENKVSYVDYTHQELLDGAPEALFNKTVTELQSTAFFHFSSDWIVTSGLHINLEDLELCHDHSGCFDIPDYSSLAWDGSVGANLINDTFGGFRFSHSTPMPLSETMDSGLFVIIGKTFNKLTSEFGLRLDNRTIKTDPTSILPSYRRDIADYDDKSFSPFSASVGLTWELSKQEFAVNLSQSKRAPMVEELYYNGDHHATFSYQLDNLELENESANSIDITWHMSHGNHLFDVAVFYYDFDGYIYNDLKTVQDPYHGRDVYRYEQEESTFTGAEISFETLVLSDWIWFVSLDTVRAQLKQGVNKNLPRTPPSSIRNGLKWDTGTWSFETDIHHFTEQDKVATNESTSDAFSTLNAYFNYVQDYADTEVNFQLKAKNMLDEYGVNHASYLKNLSPVQGRNIEAGILVKF